MVDRWPLIEQIDSLLRESLTTTDNLLFIQQLKQNDARVTFFKHVNTVLDSAILSLVLAHRYLGNENWWIETDSLYKLSKRPYEYVQRFNYFDQIVMNATFLFIFNSFEHSIRLICKQYNPDLYQQQKKSISGMCKKIRKDLDAKQKDAYFIDSNSLSHVRSWMEYFLCWSYYWVRKSN